MKKTIHILLLSVLFLFSRIPYCSAESSSADITSQTLAHIEQYITEQIEQNDIPGASIAIVSGDHTLYAKGFGVADLDTRTPVTTTTTFTTGSAVKNITATAILMLRDEGKLSLDEPITTYIPEFRLADEGISKQITIRHLLTHTGGLGYRAQEAVYWGTHENKDMTALLKNLSSFEQAKKPGISFDYSNVGYALLGAIVERVSGESYQAFIQKRIFEPLQMNDTAITPAEYGPIPQAQQYMIQFGQLKKIPRLYEEWGAPAGLGWVTNPTDWAKYVKAQLGEGPVSLLSSSTLQESYEGGVDTPLSAAYNNGWFHKSINGTNIVFHQGGASTLIALIPDKKIGIVFMGNVLSTKVWNIGFAVTGMLIQENASAIATFPPVFEALSYLWTGMTVASVVLLGILLTSIRRARRGIFPKRAILLLRAILFGVLSLLFIAYLLLVNRDMSETPNFFGTVFGFYLDQVVGVVSFATMVTVWTIYSFYLVVVGHKKKKDHPVPGWPSTPIR